MSHHKYHATLPFRKQGTPLKPHKQFSMKTFQDLDYTRIPCTPSREALVYNIFQKLCFSRNYCCYLEDLVPFEHNQGKDNPHASGRLETLREGKVEGLKEWGKVWRQMRGEPRFKGFEE